MPLPAGIKSEKPVSSARTVVKQERSGVSFTGQWSLGSDRKSIFQLIYGLFYEFS